MSKFTTIRFNAGNDTNGNPRRVYVTFCNGDIVASYDEEYAGESAIKNRHHRLAYTGITISVPPGEYKELLSFQIRGES